jgi:hypothetical protein
MKAGQIDHSDGMQAKPHPITVLVNERPVTFGERRTTGLEIKQTAIGQHVPIQVDFVLYEVNPGSHLKQVGDAETVTLKPNHNFRATAPDDNS